MVAAKKIGRNLTEGPIFKSLILFALPIILTNVIQQLYSVVDLVIIGQYVGSIGTVGVSTGGELSDIMTPISTAFATAGQVYISQLFGARDKKRLHEAIGTIITLMMGLSFLFMVGSILFCRQILTALNCPEEAFTQATSYMIITAVGMPAIFGYNAVCAILRGMGESQRPLIFIIIAAVINIVLDVVLVAVLNLEAAGTAIATVMAQFGSFAAAFVYMYHRKEQFNFAFKLSYFRIRKEPFLIIMKLGIPTLIRVFFVRFSVLWVNANINSYGLTASATNSVGNKLNKFLEVAYQGIDAAAGAMVGQNLGARKTERTKKIVWATLVCTMVTALLLIVLVLVLPKQLYRIFTQDQQVIDFGVTYLKILAVGIFVSCLIGPFNAVVTGSGFALLGFVIGILDGVICRIGISLLLSRVFEMGVLSFWWANSLCRILPCLLCMAYFAGGKWKTRKLLAH
ncbi:MAG: MATE family efflux transporter [Faecousia sp.]